MTTKTTMDMNHPEPGDANVGDEAILAGIRAVSRRHLEFDGELTLDAPIVESLALDSIKLLTLVVEIENHFRICLDEDPASGIVTVRDLVGAVRDRLAEPADDAG